MKDKHKEEMGVKLKECVICGDTFRRNNQNQKTCCRECSKQRRIENKREYLQRPEVKTQIRKYQRKYYLDRLQSTKASHEQD